MKKLFFLTTIAVAAIICFSGCGPEYIKQGYRFGWGFTEDYTYGDFNFGLTEQYSEEIENMRSLVSNGWRDPSELADLEQRYGPAIAVMEAFDQAFYSKYDTDEFSGQHSAVTPPITKRESKKVKKEIYDICKNTLSSLGENLYCPSPMGAMFYVRFLSVGNYGHTGFDETIFYHSFQENW